MRSVLPPYRIWCAPWGAALRSDSMPLGFDPPMAQCGAVPLFYSRHRRP
jgi:hypothetical protein